MIVDLQRFIDREESVWAELEGVLDRLDRDPLAVMSLSAIRQFHYLYQRVSADLSQVSGFAAEAEIRRYLASLVGRAYGHIHELRERHTRFSPIRWFFEAFPMTFRRHLSAFAISVALTLLGIVVGGALLAIDRDAKAVIMPFSHLNGDPAERVAQEERAGKEEDRLSGAKASFSAMLMTHNIQVSVTVFALGFTWGLGTILLLFYNGVIIGAVAFDYMAAGQTQFLLGWLMPHGVVEIPAVMIGGQAGLLLAGALLGRGRRIPLRTRFRRISPDIVTLLAGLAIMLVWAGIVEAFFSQYHQPVVPYGVKIAFGIVELAGLSLFLGLCGKSPKKGLHAAE
jgi:uncharacterized membrane protein SpoIIM required for sporulation